LNYAQLAHEDNARREAPRQSLQAASGHVATIQWEDYEALVRRQLSRAEAEATAPVTLPAAGQPARPSPGTMRWRRYSNLVRQTFRGIVPETALQDPEYLAEM